jgi:hypothetical protein
MGYAVEPGLYALGDPDSQSAVLVTANYKMSFDRLRACLVGLNLWILALDTKGINVWCAAGKGTFGTQELAARLASNAVGKVVSHRRLVLPQLSAPGIAAHLVRRLSDFEVIYGPIRASDLPAFLSQGMKAGPGMRRKDFPLRERVVLIPVELVSAAKWAGLIVLLLSVLSGFLGSKAFLPNALSHGIPALLAMLAAVLAGAVMTPVLLPWIPGTAFSFKGLCLGFVAAGVFLLWCGAGSGRVAVVETAAWLFIIPALSSFLAMNFTGASTYTSLSGVRKEMRWSLPFQICGGLAGVALWMWAIAF